ncbi:MAG: response regulator [Spartobacteria bacterium]
MRKGVTGGPPGDEEAAGLPAAARELNNLLQIITGTIRLLERMWEGDAGAKKHFQMLHLSIERAAEVTSRLVEQAGGSERKILLHPALTAAEQPSVRVRPAGRCIMVVDDEPMALVLSRHVLTKAGFEVVTAQSGIECLDLFRSRPDRFHLILLDLTMPVMDSEETFNRLRKIDPNAVVMLNTGFIEKHRLTRMMASGLAGFVRRPYQPAEVVAQIDAVLDSIARSGEGEPGSAPLIPF